jgi:hypothetical protein
MGLIFLRHATNRYYEAKAAIDADKAAGRMPNRPLVAADFQRRRALMLPEAARYDTLLRMPKDGKLGAALTAAMEVVEAGWLPLKMTTFAAPNSPPLASFGTISRRRAGSAASRPNAIRLCVLPPPIACVR